MCECWQNMFVLVDRLKGERLTQYRRLEDQLGPRDEWRIGEDVTATLGLSLSDAGCRALSVAPRHYPAGSRERIFHLLRILLR